ncbi:MAG: SufE family protein [Alphaproteobacteria bacterium]|nr:SufE family protein [Alphaproteobacteria bacterium]
MNLLDIENDFALLSDWEDRYAYIIDLGKGLPNMSSELKNDKTKVDGCTSQVWLTETQNSSKESLEFVADSDSTIVKGLVAILLLIYNGKSAKEAKEINIEEVFTKLGLEGHLSVNRRNGFFSMVKRIKNSI